MSTMIDYTRSRGPSVEVEAKQASGTAQELKRSSRAATLLASFVSSLSTCDSSCTAQFEAARPLTTALELGHPNFNHAQHLRAGLTSNGCPSFEPSRSSLSTGRMDRNFQVGDGYQM